MDLDRGTYEVDKGVQVLEPTRSKNYKYVSLMPSNRNY